jgi:hypothetical protein
MSGETPAGPHEDFKHGAENSSGACAPQIRQESDHTLLTSYGPSLKSCLSDERQKAQ